MSVRPLFSKVMYIHTKQSLYRCILKCQSLLTNREIAKLSGGEHRSQIERYGQTLCVTLKFNLGY